VRAGPIDAWAWPKKYSKKHQVEISLGGERSKTEKPGIRDYAKHPATEFGIARGGESGRRLGKALSRKKSLPTTGGSSKEFTPGGELSSTVAKDIWEQGHFSQKATDGFDFRLERWSE